MFLYFVFLHIRFISWVIFSTKLFLLVRMALLIVLAIEFLYAIFLPMFTYGCYPKLLLLCCTYVAFIHFCFGKPLSNIRQVQGFWFQVLASLPSGCSAFLDLQLAQCNLALKSIFSLEHLHLSFPPSDLHSLVFLV